MRVIYFTDTYYDNHGGRTHAREFLKALSKNKRIKDVILFPDQKNISKNSSYGFVFRSLIKSMLNMILPIELKIQYRLFVPNVYKDLNQVIEKKKPDLIIVRHSTYFKTYNKLRKKFPNLNIVVEFNTSLFMEGYSQISFVNYWRKKEIQALSSANYISSVSCYLKDYLSAHDEILEKKIIINPNGVDVAKFKPFSKEMKRALRKNLNIPENAIIFGYIGGMEKFRRLPEVVERFAQLRAKGFLNIFLMIIGNGTDLKNVIEMGNKYDFLLKDYFYFNGYWVNYDEIPKWVNIFDVGIFPFSNPYGSPQKIFEYAACGLPILGPEVPALQLGTGSELCTYLVKQDGSNLEELILKIYNNVEEEKNKALKIRSILEQGYTWQANVTRILNVI